MQIEKNPYGDGFAAERIAARLAGFLSRKDAVVQRADMEPIK
jgi:hypothetical protein